MSFEYLSTAAVFVSWFRFVTERSRRGILLRGYFAAAVVGHKDPVAVEGDALEPLEDAPKVRGSQESLTVVFLE